VVRKLRLARVGRMMVRGVVVRRRGVRRVENIWCVGMREEEDSRERGREVV